MNWKALFALALFSSAAIAECEIGAYRLSDGTVIDIGASHERTLRWRRFDGETGQLTATADGAWTSTRGWTGKPDGLTARFDCAQRTLRFGNRTAKRIDFDVTETRFAAGDVTLAGRLVMPRGRREVPVIVLVHGSEDSSALRFYAEQRLLAAGGVGVFVYDKRGTGESGGRYTQAFDELADDAVRALAEARRLAGGRAGRVGYFGMSQGGWVAPLAATRAPVDFIVVGYGLAVSVIDEDFEAMELEMRLKGHDMTTISKAFEIARAMHVVLESGFTQGFAQLDAVRARYRAEPWYRDVRGNFTHVFLGMSEAELRGSAERFANWRTPWRRDPMPTLRALDVPQLWILGEDDLDAPSAETAKRLRGLAREGKPIRVEVLPGAEHGMTLYEIGADGARVSTRYAPGYWKRVVDYAVVPGRDSRE
jgi:pimeloyl-ACP methyl ester carboxylesterase